MFPNSHQLDYATLELLIGERTMDGYPLTVTQSPAGEVTAYCRLDPADAELQDALAAVASRNTDVAFLIRLGSFLFDALFAGAIVELYRTSLGMARVKGQRLRVRLRIEPPELACLPWEFLHDAQEEQSFAISPEIALVRHVPMRLPVRPSAVTLPLRLLMILASPRDLPGLNVAEERRLIEEALQERIAKQEVQVQFLEVATVANIQQALRTFQPHVFHLVAHSLFDGHSVQLMLVDEQDNAAPVDERTFRELFAGSSATRVAVLNACQSGVTSNNQLLAGLAPRLLQRQLSAVVAMQYPVTDRAGLVFAREFYRSLAVGMPVDAAIDEARRGIWIELGGDQPDWGAPLLFLRAADGQLFTLADTAKTDATVPPPEPLRPPEIGLFVGREAELAVYVQHLNEAHVAIIAGMPGVGKSALAATLARQVGSERPLFWHTFHAGEGLEIVIWKLAGFLAWHGKDALWHLLQTSTQSGGRPPPPAVLTDYVFEGLRGLKALLTLDDFHAVEDDPLASHFLERLRTGVQAGDIDLIIASRRLVAFDIGRNFPPLAGLGLTEIREILARHHLVLNVQLIDQLYRTTEGNAELVTLALTVLQTTQAPEQTIAALVQSQDVERFLLREIDTGLADDQKAIMSGVAALLGYPGTRDAIEEVLDGANVRRTLAHLCNRYLLVARDDRQDREYSEHAIVQAFYYGLLTRRERKAMHLRAARYYEADERDSLRAALHYLHAGEAQHTMQLVAHDLATHINQGRAQAVANLLAQVQPSTLAPADQARRLEAQGDLHYFLGNLAEAVDSYRQALAFVDLLTIPQRVELLCKLGEVTARQGDISAALEWLEQAHALQNVASIPLQIQAGLRVSRGTVLMQLGRYAEAATEAEAVLTSTDSAQSPRTVADAHDLLGKITYFWGKIPDAIEQFDAALALRKQQGDPRDILRSYSNLAIVYERQGRTGAAIESNLAALATAERIGDIVAAAHIEANLGIAYAAQADYERALRSFDHAHTRFVRMRALSGLQAISLNLADTYMQLNQLDQAQAYVTAALGLADQLNDPEAKIWSKVTLAQIQLRQGWPEQALQTASEGQRMAAEIGIAGRADIHTLFAAIYCALGQLSEARTAYRQAILGWQENEAWPDLLTAYLDWMAMEQTQGDAEQAAELLSVARQLVAAHGLDPLKFPIKDLSPYHSEEGTDATEYTHQ